MPFLVASALVEFTLDAKAMELPLPPLTQGFNRIAKDCIKEQKCVRCAGAHKSTECPDKDKASLKLKCSYCNGDNVASYRECPKFKDQVKIQADKAKAKQEKPPK